MLGRFVVDRAKGVVLRPRDARGRNLVAQFSVAQAAKDQNGSGLTEKFNGLPSTGTGLIPVSRGPQKRPSAALVARQALGVESGGLCRASCSNPSHRDSRGADLANPACEIGSDGKRPRPQTNLALSGLVMAWKKALLSKPGSACRKLRIRPS